MAEDEDKEKGQSYCISMQTVLINVSILLVFFVILFFGSLFMKQFKLTALITVQMIVLGAVGMSLFKL